MRFKIKTDERDTEKARKLLDEFVTKSRDEFDRQMESVKKLPIPVNMVFDTDFYEEEKNVFILWNTVSMKGVMRLMSWRLKGSMEKNLKAFLKDNGISATVDYLGD